MLSRDPLEPLAPLLLHGGIAVPVFAVTQPRLPTLRVVEDGEAVTGAIERVLNRFGLIPKTISAGEHAYIIYNRRFAEMQIVGVYAAEVTDAPVRLERAEHSEHAWMPYEACLERVHYRGLKDGLRSVQEYVTGPRDPASELRLFP